MRLVRSKPARLAVLVLAAVLAMVAGSLVWLVKTEHGADTLVRYALGKVAPESTIASIQGTLSSGLAINRLGVELESQRIAIDQVKIGLSLTDLLRRKVTVEHINIEGIDVSLDPTTPRKSNEPLVLPESVELPIDVDVRELTVSDLTVKSEGKVLAIVTELEARLMVTDGQLRVDALDLRAPEGSIVADLSLTLAAPYPLELEVHSSLALGDLPELRSTTHVEGDLGRLSLQHVSLPPFDLSVAGNVEHLLQTTKIDTVVTLNEINLQAITGGTAELAPSGTLTLAGTRSDLAIGGTVSAWLPTAGDTTLTLDARWSPDRIELNRVTAFFADLGNELNPLPTGTAEASGHSKGVTVTATGDVSLEREVPDADVTIAWDVITWPLTGEASAASRQGQAEIKGTLDRFAAKVSSTLDTQLGETGEVQIELAGTSEELIIQRANVDWLEGTITGAGRLQLSGDSDFSLKVEADNINPGGLSSTWPGHVSATAQITGKLDKEDVWLEVSPLNINGRLRGYPLNVAGRGSLRRGVLSIETFDWVSGPTRLTTSGTASESLDLIWDIESTDLNSLLPGLSGALVGQGTARGTVSRPLIAATLAGTQLGYADLSIGSLDGTITTTVDNGLLSGQAGLVANDLRADAYEAQSVSVRLNGSSVEHSVNVELSDTLGATSVTARGTLAGQSNYKLILDKFNVDANELGLWALESPVTLERTDQRLHLPLACLSQEPSSLCMSVDQQTEGLTTEVDVKDVPLSLIAHWLPTSVKLAGRVNGGGALEWSTTGQSVGQLTFDLDNVSVDSRFRKKDGASTLRFSSSVLEARVDQNGTLRANARFPLQSGGGVELSGSLLGNAEAATSLLDRRLSAEANISIPSVAFLAEYVPQLDRIDGTVEGKVAFSGTLARPEVLGSLAFQDGLLNFADPGVQASDVTMSFTGSADNRIKVNGAATSGGGRLTLTGELGAASTGYTGRFELKGNEFQVLNTSSSQVWATPDVTLAYDGTALELAGSIDVPRANIEVDALPKGTVRVSKDQRLVGAQERTEATSTPFSANLKIDLGDDVRLAAFGLDAFLEGALVVQENGSSPTSAIGEITLRDGQYDAYGQRLDITTGKLVYAGGAIDQPGIDFRATRKPSPDIEVGIAARGTLNEPSFSVFSTPVMSESDQLAYLVFGRPLNAEAASENTLISRLALSLSMQGGEALSQKLAGELGVDQLAIESQGSGELSQASLVIGKYLSPKLFVSYGIGLLEPISTLKLEYALSSKWQLVTESSTLRNSADAQYTFER